MFNLEQAAAYLAGMIDGEGWIGEPKGLHNRAIRIANTDPDLIAAIQEACDVLGVTYTTHAYKGARENWSPGWFLDISGRENLTRVHQLVPIRSAKKWDRLARTLTSYRMPLPLERATLEALYVGEGLAMPEVAQRLGVSLKRVRLAMVRHGIERRGHGPERAAAVWRARRARHGPSGRR